MPVEDSNPERRNLVVLSMAIIAFYVGGCEIPASGEIELPLIKLKFTDAYHLAWLVWVMLAWFWFRYWIENKHVARERIYVELDRKNYGLSLFKPQLRKLYLLDRDESTRQFIFRRCEANGDPSFLCVVEKTDPEDYNPDPEWEPPMYDVKSKPIFRLMVFVAQIKLFFKFPSLSAYYAPHCIFIVACLIGFLSSLRG